MRQFYIDVKNGLISKSKAAPEPDTNKLLVKIIPWTDFSNIEILEKGVCGLKVCCIRVIYKNDTYIIKEMRKSFNYGRDYKFIDSLKTEFGIRDLGMKLIKVASFSLTNYPLIKYSLHLNI